jgi:hypothetical protein
MSQLLPDKFVPTSQSLVGQGATIIEVMAGRALSVAQLFVEVRQRSPHLTYDAFGLSLSTLYATGLVESVDNTLIRPANA